MNEYVKELIKYPIIGLSLVLTLWLAKISLGLEFGNISEVGSDGIKFFQKQQAEFTSLSSDYENKIHELDIRLALLEKTVVPADDTTKLKEDYRKSVSNNFEKFQTVSDKVAQISELRISDKETELIEGYIWIGNFNKATKKWSKLLLQNVDKNTAPDQIKIAETYQVNGNMLVRKSLPPNNVSYYKLIPGVGVVPKNSSVTILESARAIDREYTIQYWIKIKYTKE